MPSTRKAETREAQSRKKSWKPPETLQAPDPVDGYRYKWVRMETAGVADNRNVVRKTSEGWEPVRQEEIPEGFVSERVEDGKHAGVVRAGDLILCKMPDEFVEQRDEYYKERRLRLEESVKTDLNKHQSSEMPISDESVSKVRTGRGAFQD